MSKDAKVEFDSENQKINITGLIDSSIEIDYSKDVDFTLLISHLTKFIDTSEEINLSLDSYDEVDSKLKIVVETIQSIFEKYSESLGLILEEDEDLPF